MSWGMSLNLQFPYTQNADDGSIKHPLSIGFPRQEYWSGLSFASPRDLPDPGIKPESLAL